MATYPIRAPWAPPSTLRHKAPTGTAVAEGDVVVVLERDGLTIEVRSPCAGIWSSELPYSASEVEPGALLGGVTATGPWERLAQGPDPAPTPEEAARWTPVRSMVTGELARTCWVRAWWAVPGDHLAAGMVLARVDHDEWTDEPRAPVDCVVRARVVGVEEEVPEGEIIAWVEALS